MQTLLTYDIKATSATVHLELKKRLIESYKFSNTIQSSDNNIYHLPNTTLMRYEDSLEKSSADFVSACKDVGAKWEKFIVVDWNAARFNNQ